MQQKDGYIEDSDEDGYIEEKKDGSIVDKASMLSQTGLSKVEFRVFWLLVMTLHALCACYLLAMAKLYFFMEGESMTYYANLMSLPSERRFRLFGGFVGLLGVLHATQLILHLLWCIRARALVVWPWMTIGTRVMKFVRKFKPTSEITKSPSRRKSILHTPSKLLSVLGIDGDLFELMFLLRKVVEIAAQIIQCYHYSTLISQVWINQAFVAMVVSNCLLTPLLNHVMLVSASRTHARIASTENVTARLPAVGSRTLCVSVDVLLTAISCLVLPLAIFAPWAQQYDPLLEAFPTEVLYSDVTFTSLVFENKAIFALSTSDSLSKLVPHLSILLGLTTITLVLERDAPSTSQRKLKQSIATVAVAKRKSSTKIPTSVSPSPTTRSGTVKFWQHIVAIAVFVAAAIAVLVLHVRADHRVANAKASTAKMCIQTVRPWFARNASCSIIQYNCHRQGVASPASDSLDDLERESLASIIFAHCSALEMPASIREFPNLLGLELWNVTLVHWGPEAGLDAKLLPKLGFLMMIKVNMTDLPEGVLGAPLPDLLIDIEIVLTNLTRITEKVTDAWSNVQVVYLEHTPLVEFPIALFRLPVVYLSLANNGLSELPPDLFMSDEYLSEFYILTLSYNPLHSLPDTAKQDLYIDWLMMTHTEVTMLPAWFEETVVLAELGNSPVCGNEEAQLPEIVDCTESEWSPLDSGVYPLAFVELSREV